MKGRGLEIALALDAIVPIFEQQRLSALADQINSGLGHAKVWAKRNLDILQRLSNLGIGRGIDNTNIRFIFPYASVPVWLTSVFGNDQSSGSVPEVVIADALGGVSTSVAASSSSAASSLTSYSIRIFADALIKRQTITISHDLSKLVHRYAAPFLRDLAMVMLMFSAAAFPNVFGMFSVVLAGLILVTRL